MYHTSGRLAAVLVRVRERVRVAVTAASFLILALLSSGCGVLLERTSGIRLFTILTTLWELLPEKIPSTPYEFFVEAVGADFGERFGAFILRLAIFPPIFDSPIWSTVIKIASLVAYAVAGFYFLRYLSKVGEYVDERGMRAVNAGATKLVPPMQYLLKRLGIYIILVVPMVRLVPFFMGLVSDTISGMALALYSEQSMASVIQDLFVMMLDGVQVWMFLLTFAVNFIGGLVFLGFLTYRVISIPIYTALIYIHTPQFLGGEGPGELSKPLERTIHRILVLAVTSFFVIIGPLLVLELGQTGFPVSIGVAVSIVLATIMPWVVFRWIPFTRDLPRRISAPIDNITTTPGVGLSEEEMARESFWRRTWNRLPAPMRKSAEIGVEILKREPHAGPIIATGEVVYEHIQKSQDDPRAGGRAIAKRLFQDERFDVSAGKVVGPGAVSPTSRKFPAFDALMKAATEQGLSEKKDDYSPELYATVSALAALRYGVSTIEELEADALTKLGSMDAHRITALKAIGERLKDHT